MRLPRICLPATPDQAPAAQDMAAQDMAGHFMAGHFTAGQVTAGQVTAGQVTAGHCALVRVRPDKAPDAKRHSAKLFGAISSRANPSPEKPRTAKSLSARTRTALLSLALLAACAPIAVAPVSKGANTLDGLDLRGPALHFSAQPGLPTQRPNPQIAQDFLNLEFRLESGLALPVLTRFEGPISVSMRGSVPATARTDLAALIARLRAEAGLTITLLPDNQPATITVDFQHKSALHRIEASAACFVIPNVSSMAEYRASRGTEALDWARMRVRKRATLFLPSDSSPQEVRDCLHEEMAQALGPVNDLYRLPDSVFNDDNFQSVLTGFDMLMLRLHYAPELTSGLTEAEVAERLPALLARMNPRGQRAGGWASPGTPRGWIDQVNMALNPQTLPALRLAAASRALAFAEAQGWQDNRLAFAWFIKGRLLAPRDPAGAGAAYANAARIYQTLPDGGVHLSHALMQLAAIALASGQDDQVLALTGQAIPIARAAQNAGLLATLQLIRAQALDRQGHGAEARALRLDSLPAARYGFGAETEVRARAAEIAAIARLFRPG